MSETKSERQREVSFTLWKTDKGRIIELKVPSLKVPLSKLKPSRRLVFLAVLIPITVRVGVDRLPEIAEWVNNLLALLG